jgi:hypothetical protein
MLHGLINLTLPRAGRDISASKKRLNPCETALRIANEITSTSQILRRAHSRVPLQKIRRLFNSPSLAYKFSRILR